MRWPFSELRIGVVLVRRARLSGWVRHSMETILELDLNALVHVVILLGPIAAQVTLTTGITGEASYTIQACRSQSLY